MNINEWNGMNKLDKNELLVFIGNDQFCLMNIICSYAIIEMKSIFSQELKCTMN
jgi:hypothetical protein